MQQILFHLPQWLPWIGGMPIYGYGVMMVIGFFAALQLAKFLARRSGIDPEVFVNAGLIALLTGVIGSRLSHVLENLGQYTDPPRSFGANLWDAINLRSGGLTFYGGFLLATPCTIAYGLIKKVPIRLGMDIVAPCLMIGLGFGRIGCLLNGCCYGAEAVEHKVPWALEYKYGSNAYVDEFEKGKVHPPKELTATTEDGRVVLLQPQVVEKDPVLRAMAEKEHSEPLHPAQVYSTITAWIIAALLVAYFTMPHVPGRVFALMLIIEAPARFLLEMLRSEPPVVGPASDPPHLTFLPNMSFSMVLSIGLFLAGVILWFAFRKGTTGAAAEVVETPRVAVA
jgi:phosphatidylglycerol---prolipoprotein diacylglyceryl transferase